MIYGPASFTDKTGREIIIRNAEEQDAAMLIEYMSITAGETPFLLREPDEQSFTLEQETAFIQMKKDAERELMITAFCDGEHVGCASLMSEGPRLRFRHRCSVAVAIYRKFWGAGIGEMMLRVLIDTAKEAGYEQMELEVVEGNDRARALYEKLGFKQYGAFPRNMKYKDGSYRDSYWMMKDLR